MEVVGEWIRSFGLGAIFIEWQAVRLGNTEWKTVRLGSSEWQAVRLGSSEWQAVRLGSTRICLRLTSEMITNPLKDTSNRNLIWNYTIKFTIFHISFRII